jgi:hypothetical protein
LIINKFYIAPINFLLCILFLLHLEYMLLKLKQFDFYVINIIHLRQQWCDAVSRSYNLAWLKCCCNFSFVKLMHSCSKL